MTAETKKAFRQETIETMDRHAKTVSLLFHDFMMQNSYKLADNLSDAYDLFVYKLTVENKIPEV